MEILANAAVISDAAHPETTLDLLLQHGVDINDKMSMAKRAYPFMHLGAILRQSSISWPKVPIHCPRMVAEIHRCFLWQNLPTKRPVEAIRRGRIPPGRHKAGPVES